MNRLVVIALAVSTFAAALCADPPRRTTAADNAKPNAAASAVPAVEGHPGHLRQTQFGRLVFSQVDADSEVGAVRAVRVQRSAAADSPMASDASGLVVPADQMRADDLGRVAKAERLTHLVLVSKPTGVRLAPLGGAAALTALDVSGGSVSDADLEALAKVRGLTVLDLTGCVITDAGTDALNGVLPPGTVDLGRPPDLGLAEIAALKGLTAVGLPQPATDDWVKGVAALPRLEVLGLRGTRVTDRGLRHLDALDRLRALDLGGTPVTDAGLESLGKLPNLTALHLGHTKVTQSGVQALKRIPKLATLHLSGCPVTADGLRELRHLTELTELHLNGCKVPAAAVAELRHLPKLRTLDLSYTDLTDEMVKELRPLTDLARLDLAYTDLTDRALTDLAALKGLTHLRLDDTYVSPEAEAKLRAALQGCRVSATRVLR